MVFPLRPLPARLSGRLLLAAAFLFLLATAQVRETLDHEFAGQVTIRVRRSDTGEPMPARVYLFKGETPFRLSPADSLLPLRVDLFYRERLWRGTPDPRVLEVTARDFSHYLLLEGEATFELPAAPEYRLEVYRGLFFEPAEIRFGVAAGERKTIDASLAPVAPGRQERWLAADDHIHLMRAREDDPVFLKWLAAEDLAVGNFLELQRQQHAAVQYGFGERAEARKKGYSIRSGHESRSVFYGHVLLLGGESMVRPLSIGSELANTPEAWPMPSVLFAQGRQAGALTGYAHFYGSTPHSSLLANLVRGSIDFVELFQFGVLRTAEWYELLNAGFRVTGLAGSDFPVPLNRQEPWPRAVPLLGPERALVEAAPGESAYQAWARGVRQGAVLLSNGPLLEFSVNGAQPGSVIRWEGPEVRIEGSAAAFSFRPIEKLEIVVNGEVAAYEEPAPPARGSSRRFRLRLDGSAWVAARAKAASRRGEPEIWAHTNPVYFLKEGRPVERAGARESVRARWRKEAEYYRTSALVFAEESHRRELAALVAETTAALEAPAAPWPSSGQ